MYNLFLAVTACYDTLQNRYLPRYDDKVLKNIPTAAGCKYFCQEEEGFKCVFAEYIKSGRLF